MGVEMLHLFADRRTAPYIPGYSYPSEFRAVESRTARPFDSTHMERFRSQNLTRAVSGTLAIALLCAVAGSFTTNRAADHMVDRVSRSFSGDDTVMTAATSAAAESPGSFDEFLVMFVGLLEESGTSAGEILIGQAMSQTRLLDLLRQRFSNEFASAVSPRQILTMAASAATASRDRILWTTTDTQTGRTSPVAGPVVADAAAEARLISCGFKCSSVQPLGP